MDMQAIRENLTGLLSFPLTPFGPGGELDLPRFREHVHYQLETDAKAVFVVCGTGEFVSLGFEEHRSLIEAAVAEAAGDKPVFAGVGYGWSLGVQMTQAAERAGADGVLVLPPYLVKGGQEGLYQHYRRIAEATSLAVIMYQRDTAVFAPETVRRLAEVHNVIGLKDALGDTDHLTRIRIACEDGISLMNGMPTAEMTALAYQACGVASYSSAVLNFVPEIANAFFRAVGAEETEVTDRLLAGFFIPFVELRDEREGYAVSLVKSGVNLRGKPVGDPRAPLQRPDEQHLERLAKLIDRGLQLI